MKQNEKLYIVLLEWCENSDDGTEVVCVTTDLSTAQTKVKELRDQEVSKCLTYQDPDDPICPEKPWVVMDDNPNKFYHHGYFPDFCSIKVLEFIDPKPICPETV